MIHEYEFESAEWQTDSLTGEIYTVKVVIHGDVHIVPKDMDNSIYCDLMRQVDAGNIVISGGE